MEEKLSKTEKKLSFENNLSVSYFSDFKVTNPTQLIITVHGCKRNAEAYLDKISSPKKDVLYASIKFPIKREDEDSISWSSNSAWIRGNYSYEGPSSFEVMDDLLKFLTDKFPSIKNKIITGHSAGGQFVHRYAFYTKASWDTFVVSNPSSYLYLNEFRASDKEPFTFEKSEYKDYNKYRYGLEKVNKVLKKIDLDAAKDAFLQKDVVYLVGGIDADINSRYLENNPPCRAQGFERLDRSKKHFAHISNFFEHNHRILVVPGVGHAPGKMFQSEVAKKLFYGEDNKFKQPFY